MPTIKDLKEFVKEIPPTPEGKLKALNTFILKEKNTEEAMLVMMEFTRDLMRNRPDYYEALKNCKTEEEIKKASEEFFKNNPDVVKDVLLSLAAAQRNKEEASSKK